MTDAAASTTQTGQQSSSGASQSTSTTQASDAGSQTTTETQAPSRPEYAPEEYWDSAKGEIKPEFTTYIGGMAARVAAEDARIAARPEKPDGYKLELPETFKSDVALKFDETDPRVATARAFAHELNLDQAGFSRLLEIEASRVVAETKAYETAQAAEIKKLGTNGTARVTAAKTFIAGIVGADGAQQFMDRMVLASDVELVEKLQQAFSTQGGANYSNGGRTQAPPPEKPLTQKLWPLRQGAS